MNSLERFFEEDTNSPIRKLIYKAAKAIAQFTSIDDVFKWLGLHKFPQNQAQQGPNPIPTQAVDSDYRMGVTISHHSEVHLLQRTVINNAAAQSQSVGRPRSANNVKPRP